jgi:hypothetical protein
MVVAQAIGIIFGMLFFALGAWIAFLSVYNPSPETTDPDDWKVTVIGVVLAIGGLFILYKAVW